MMNWGFILLILSKMIALLKNYLNSKKNVNIYLMLVIKPKDCVNKEKRQSAFFLSSSWLYEHIQKSLILQIFMLFLFQSCLDDFLGSHSPPKKGFKIRIYQQKLKQKKKRREITVKSQSRRFFFQITRTKLMR